MKLGWYVVVITLRQRRRDVQLRLRASVGTNGPEDTLRGSRRCDALRRRLARGTHDGHPYYVSERQAEPEVHDQTPNDSLVDEDGVARLEQNVLLNILALDDIIEVELVASFASILRAKNDNVVLVGIFEKASRGR